MIRDFPEAIPDIFYLLCSKIKFNYFYSCTLSAGSFSFFHTFAWHYLLYLVSLYIQADPCKVFPPINFDRHFPSYQENVTKIPSIFYTRRNRYLHPILLFPKVCFDKPDVYWSQLGTTLASALMPGDEADWGHWLTVLETFSWHLLQSLLGNLGTNHRFKTPVMVEKYLRQKLVNSTWVRSRERIFCYVC